ncbi:MAG: NAD(P)H-dependent oxidoreductase [Oscillospiraceae bacterium]|jgi:chromate reductase|nr:NAD(P)H-dependent oxidoreductase [Oscillospiraceae bacterium]
MKKIGILVGSARRGSFCQAIAGRLATLLPEGFEADFLKIDDLAMFLQDYDDDGAVPEAWARFRAQVRGYDAFIFVTPEYNRSVPPLLKNAVDIASRPFGQNTWKGKPAMVLAVSPGRVGGFAAFLHLRQILGSLNMRLLGYPETFLGDVVTFFDEEGVLSDEPNLLLQQWAKAFARWVELVG